MTQLKFDENGVFIPQKINYENKKDEITQEMIDKYVKKKINFQIDYDHEGNPIFKGKNRGMKNESI